MFKKNEPTRLGEVLLNKGLISSEQLAHAIKEQASRRKGADLQDPAVLQATSLGEVLIALGYIDRLQLQRGLNWQMKLRKMTIAMALCAPFMSLSTGAAAAAAKIISAVPAVVEAEEYSSMSGVALETTYDTGGGSNVKSIDAGDFIKFTDINVDLPATGTYIISYRVASVDGGSITFNNEGTSTTKIDTITVPKTGSAQTWVTVQRTVSLKSGAHYFSIKGVSGSVNLNWFKIEAAGSTSSSSSSSTSSSSSSAPPTMASTTPTTLSPITIQAENYSAMSGVYNEDTLDVGGGQDTGNINTGDWMTYTNTNVTVPITGTYKVTYRVASLSAGGSFSLTEAATGEVLGTVSVPVTGGWQNWVDVTTTVKLSAGTHNFGIKAIAGGFNVNWFRIEGTASSSSSSSSTSTTGYLSTTIQAENYSAMSGVYNEATSDVGGGQDAGNINTGDWMVYTNASVNVPTTGTYNVTYRVASLAGGGSLNLVEAGVGTVYDTASIPKTGDWQSWVDVKRTVTLTAGLHSFGITAVTGGFNVNWFKIESVGATSSSSTSSVRSSSSVSSVSSSSSSKPAVSSSSLSSSSAATSSISSSTSSAGVVSTAVAGPVGMSWVAPSARLDGTVLDISEIGGYEIRYKLATDTNYTYISINDAYTTQYNFSWLEGNYVFQVAAFDKNGVYSNFVDVVSAN